MSLDKAIKHGKEHREEYRRSARFDRSCRNKGNCDYCKRARLFHHYKEEQKVEQELREPDPE